MARSFLSPSHPSQIAIIADMTTDFVNSGKGEGSKARARIGRRKPHTTPIAVKHINPDGASRLPLSSDWIVHRVKVAPVKVIHTVLSVLADRNEFDGRTPAQHAEALANHFARIDREMSDMYARGLDPVRHGADCSNLPTEYDIEIVAGLIEGVGKMSNATGWSLADLKG